MRLSSGQPSVCCTRPGRCFSGLHLPQLLEAEAVFLRLAALARGRTWPMSSLASEPRAPSAMMVYLPRSSMPRLKRSVGLPSLPMPYVAGGHADDRALVVVEHLGRGEPGIDLHAQLGGLLAQPAHTLPRLTM